MSNRHPYQHYSQAGSAWSPQQQQQYQQHQYQQQQYQYYQQPQQHQYYQQQQSQAMPTDDEMDAEIPAEESQHWDSIEDPLERRKMQNRFAQRRFRAKKKEQREEARRDQDNRARAGSAYQSPEPRELAEDRELSGLPWGGLSMRHMVQTGRAKEEESRRGSQEPSAHGAASRAGGSSRVGLLLSHGFARRQLMWEMFYRQNPDLLQERRVTQSDARPSDTGKDSKQ